MFVPVTTWVLIPERKSGSIIKKGEWEQEDYGLYWFELTLEEEQAMIFLKWICMRVYYAHMCAHP